MRVEIELNKVIKDEYNIRRRTDYDGTINIVLTPKKRKCKVCAKEFQSKGREFLYWKTSDNYEVYGWFCKRHYAQANQLLKELK